MNISLMNDNLKWTDFIILLESMCTEIAQGNFEVTDNIEEIVQRYINNAGEPNLEEREKTELLFSKLEIAIKQKVEEIEFKYQNDIKTLQKYKKYLNTPHINQNNLSLWK